MNFESSPGVVPNPPSVRIRMLFHSPNSFIFFFIFFFWRSIIKMLAELNKYNDKDYLAGKLKEHLNVSEKYRNRVNKYFCFSKVSCKGSNNFFLLNWKKHLKFWLIEFTLLNAKACQPFARYRRRNGILCRYFPIWIISRGKMIGSNWIDFDVIGSKWILKIAGSN